MNALVFLSNVNRNFGLVSGFSICYNEGSPYLILHQLTKFQCQNLFTSLDLFTCQNLFTSQVICVLNSSLDTFWRCKL